VSPTYGRLSELGASWGEKSGWERANWFEPNAAHGDPSLRPRGWAGEIWSPAIGAEHTACRSAAAVFDETSFAKIDVTGAGAAAFLQRLCDNDVDRPVGTVTYTSMLNERGGIECDFTVTRLAEDRFRIVTGTAFGQHDLVWIRSHAPDDVTVVDLTSAYACLGVWGPAARELLQPVADADLSNEAFPYMRARELSVGPVPCLALRVTYVGELGWELYAEPRWAVQVWDRLMEAGAEAGITPAGYRALDSLRLEKGYRYFGTDLTPDENPFEAGLGFCVALDGDRDFIGRDAVAAARDEGVRQRLRTLLVGGEDYLTIYGGEAVHAGGSVVARLRSAGYGFTVRRNLAYAYLPVEIGIGDAVEVEVFGERVPAEVGATVQYDPANGHTTA
jgi:4-methylaminobutanoate oxidase (formaldehyde-forming)